MGRRLHGGDLQVLPADIAASLAVMCSREQATSAASTSQAALVWHRQLQPDLQSDESSDSDNHCKKQLAGHAGHSKLISGQTTMSVAAATTAASGQVLDGGFVSASKSLQQLHALAIATAKQLARVRVANKQKLASVAEHLLNT